MRGGAREGLMYNNSGIGAVPGGGAGTGGERGYVRNQAKEMNLRPG